MLKDKEVLKKIRQIEIHTKRLLRGALVGERSSALKGSGFEFDQIRDYQYGDDVRFIDWKSSARMNRFLVKQYIEERNRVICLAVDASQSGFFSSQAELKYEIMAQTASVLALVADYGRDLTSLILFTDKIEVFIPPGRGSNHTRNIMRALFGFKPTGGTSINTALRYLAELKKRDAMAFLISDFIDLNISEKMLKIVSKIYDCIAVRCLDKNEKKFPEVDFLNISDSEDVENQLLISTKGSAGNLINDYLKRRLLNQNSIFKKNKIDILDLSANKYFIGDIIRFFRRRAMY